MCQQPLMRTDAGGYGATAGPGPMVLLLGDLPGIEQVELDSAGDPGDAGLSGLARREVSGLLGLSGTGPVRAVPDEEAGHEDLQQERRQCEVCLVRGESRDRDGRGAT